MNSQERSFPVTRPLIFNDNYAALALAIVQKAALDLRRSNPACAAEARAWLMLVGISWCQMLGVTEIQLASWAANNFFLQPSSHRNWRY